MKKLANDHGSLDWPIVLGVALIGLFIAAMMMFPGNGGDYKIPGDTSNKITINH